MSKIKVAFDIGNSSLKIAVFKNNTTTLHEVHMHKKIIKYDIIAMPNAFSAFLKKLKKELDLPKGPAGLVLPASHSLCRLITMPIMTVDQLNLNLPYEFNDFINGEPEQFFCDYALCEPMENETENNEITMMAAVASKQTISDYIKMFASAGFKLTLLIPKEISLIRLVQDYKKTLPDGQNEFCFIDIGQTSTNIYMIVNDRIQAQRQIPIALKDVDSVVADMLNIDVFLADAYKRANSNNVLECEQCIDIYNRIAVEVLKVVNFYQFTYRNNNLNGIYLIGGGANIKPLKDVLYDAIGMNFLDVHKLIQGDNDINLSNICLTVSGIAHAKGSD